MNLFGLFQISGSALTAERLRAEVATSNLANSETTRTPEGGPYQRRMVVFSSQPASPFHLLLANSAGAAAALQPGWRARQLSRGRSDASAAPLRARTSRRRRRRLCGLSGNQSGAGDGGPDGRRARLRTECQRGTGGQADDSAVAADSEVRYGRD